MSAALACHRATLDVRRRWGPSTSVDAHDGIISVPLDWLRTHNVAVLDLLAPSAPTCADLLASATVPVILFDDVRMSTPSISPLIPALGHHPSSLVVVNRLTRPRSGGNIGEDPQLAATTMQLRSSLARTLTRESGLRVPDTFPVDTVQALLALQSFASRSSTSALPAYAASGLTALRARIESLLAPPEATTRVQDATASRTVASLTQSWVTAMARVGEADAVLEDFRGRLADLRADARRILEEGVGGGAERRGIDVGGRQECERVLGTCLKWWKLPWKVDDVGWYVRNAIDGGYGKSLNQRVRSPVSVSGPADERRSSPSRPACSRARRTKRLLWSRRSCPTGSSPLRLRPRRRLFRPPSSPTAFLSRRLRLRSFRRLCSRRPCWRARRSSSPAAALSTSCIVGPSSCSPRPSVSAEGQA